MWVFWIILLLPWLSQSLYTASERWSNKRKRTSPSVSLRLCQVTVQYQCTSRVFVCSNLFNHNCHNAIDSSPPTVNGIVTARVNSLAIGGQIVTDHSWGCEVGTPFLSYYMFWLFCSEASLPDLHGYGLSGRLKRALARSAELRLALAKRRERFYPMNSSEELSAMCRFPVTVWSADTV